MVNVGRMLVVLACLLVAGLLAGIPYVIYIGVRYGWLDERVQWAMVGVPLSLLALLLARVGFFFIEGSTISP